MSNEVFQQNLNDEKGSRLTGAFFCANASRRKQKTGAGCGLPAPPAKKQYQPVLNPSRFGVQAVGGQFAVQGVKYLFRTAAAQSFETIHG